MIAPRKIWAGQTWEARLEWHKERDQLMRWCNDAQPYHHDDVVRELVEAVSRAADRIDELNTLPADENGHHWRDSDLLDQEVMGLRAALSKIAEDAP